MLHALGLLVALGAVFGLNSSADRVRLGFESFSRFIHLPISSGLIKVKPVTLPPGCERLLTKPRLTGSFSNAQTIGIEVVSCKSAAITGVPLARITAGARATISRAYCVASSTLPAVQRYSK